MFCENCGKQNADGAKFCEGCGSPLNVEAAPAPTPAPEAAAAAAVAAPATPKVSLIDKIKQIHQKNKFILPIAAGVLVLAIVLICVFTALGKQVYLQDYLNIEITGVNGYGELDYEMDYYTLFMRLEGDKSAKKAGDCTADYENMTAAQYEALAKRAETYNDLFSSIQVDVVLPEGRTIYTLCNGDEIVFTIGFDESLAKDLDGVNLKSKKYTYTVSGLGEAATYDVLSNFSLAFSGYNGFGSYEIVCTKTESKTVGNVTITTTEGSQQIQIDDGNYPYTYAVFLEEESYNDLSNGDTLHLIVHSLEADDFTEEGVLLTGLTKELTVSGLGEAESMDLLEYYDFSYTGLNGSGKLVITPTQESLTVGELVFDLSREKITPKDDFTIYYDVDYSQSYNLSNGDTITITIDIDMDEIKEHGVTLSRTELTLTVSGLSTYVTELASVTGASNYTEMVTWGHDIVNDFLNDNWSRAVHGSYWGSYSEQSIGEITLHKAILTTPKSSTSSTRNTMWLIYSVTLDDNSMDPTLFYFAISVSNTVVNSDGILDYTSYGSSTKYVGTTDYDTIYTNNIALYNVNVFEEA